MIYLHDGRDVSWLWDVDFKSLNDDVVVSGTRAYDIALRLKYDDVKVNKITTDIELCINQQIKAGADFCNLRNIYSNA